MKQNFGVAAPSLLPALITFATLSLPVGAGLGQDGGPIGQWSFDSTGDVVDDSAMGRYPGVIQNSENVRHVEGKGGPALEFGGERAGTFGCVTIDGLSDINLSKGFTFEAWIRLGDKHTRPDTCYIASDGPERGPGWRLIISYDRLFIQSGDGEVMWGASSVLRQQAPFDINRWYHVAATYDGSVFRLYLDGIEMGESESGLKLIAGGDVLSIGSYQGGAHHGFKGAIDEVKLYDRARSPLEIIKAARLE